MFLRRLCSMIEMHSSSFLRTQFIAAILSLSFFSNDLTATELTVKSNYKPSDQSRLSKEELREIFFARQTRWSDGSPIYPFVLPDDNPLHIRFSKEILGVYPYQLRAAWDRMIYSGTGVPPAVVDDVEEMREKIEQTPGGIGYFEE